MKKVYLFSMTNGLESSIYRDSGQEPTLVPHQQQQVVLQLETKNCRSKQDEIQVEGQVCDDVLLHVDDDGVVDVLLRYS